jgi:hypothetical protein
MEERRPSRLFDDDILQAFMGRENLWLLVDNPA